MACAPRYLHVPQGKPYTQETAKRLRNDYDHLVLVCGHYEGIDERFIEDCVDEEISLGDFVLTGGEIAAMAVADSVCRLVPGVLADEQCYTGESHWDGPLNTRSTHGRVGRARGAGGADKRRPCEGGALAAQEAAERTMNKRPDMFEKFTPADDTDRKLLEAIKKDASRIKLTESLITALQRWTICRISCASSRMRGAASKRFHVDQWQGEYPNEQVFLADMARGECFAVTHGGEVALVFVLSTLEQENYAKITDGKWTADMPYCVVAPLRRIGEIPRQRDVGIHDEMRRAAGGRGLRPAMHPCRYAPEEQGHATVAARVRLPVPRQRPYR